MLRPTTRLDIEFSDGGAPVTVDCRWVYVRDMCLTYCPEDLPEGTMIGIPILRISRFRTFTPHRVVGTAPVEPADDVTRIR